ncbi:coiled coil domain-containing protein [Yoonia algicola]|uniref:Coiled coil domain-containing protein n=1 Tax=Yoonia algicola TaxID=3137368 RepID=A0AAN0M3E8_9RHOB
MGMKDAYVQKLQAQLDEWNAEIDKLKSKTDSAQADAKIEYYEQIDNLRQQQLEAQARLNELQNAGETAWEDLKAGVESAWYSLESSVKKASSRF